MKAMKTMTTTMVLAALSATASAQEATPDTWTTEAKSVASRAEVRAEAIHARQSGLLARYEDPGYIPVVAHSRTRAEVLAELQRARNSGKLAMLSAEAYDFWPAPGSSVYAARRPTLARR